MEPQYKVGDEVDLYLDYQNNGLCIGKGRLVEFISIGLPFLLEDNPITKKLNKVYVAETWVVEIINSTMYSKGFTKEFKIRVLHGIGPTDSGYEGTPEINLIRDKFRIIEDYDTSFWSNRVDESEVTGELY